MKRDTGLQKLFFTAISVAVVLTGFQSFAAVDWSQPPVACVEEVVPSVPDRQCLDLSTVANPMKDLPGGMGDGEAQYWRLNKQGLYFCRAQEVLRRERLQPGSQSGGALETAWMRQLAVENHAKKVAAIYEASRTYKVPAQVLTGALYQESLFAQLGIAEDGGNYSCGIGQVNISEWCRWAARQGTKARSLPGWPKSQSECSLISPANLKPFYDIALTRLNGKPEYKLLKEHFAKISFDQVAHGFPASTEQVQRRRFEIANVFINTCSEVRSGIMAKAHELAILYHTAIPKAFRMGEIYPVGRKFQRACLDRGDERRYPLSLGWLLAVGVYNAGPKTVDTLAYFNKWTSSDLEHAETLRGFTVLDMVKSLYWAGRYDSVSDRIKFTNLKGESANWTWFRQCVLQRHIARVVQHVTVPGTPAIVDSLENGNPCAKSKYDPTTGVLIQTGVPRMRQVSSGQID